MAPGQSPSLQLPSFLHGTFPSVHQKTAKEGTQCGEQYLRDGTFPMPRQMQEVPPGEVVVAHEVVDFQRERPAWRLYMVSNVKNSLYEALEGRNTIPARDAYEAFFRETAWGALYFAIHSSSPESAERTAVRLRAVLRYWEPLQSVRYLFKHPGAAHTLDELMTAACGWALEAWCPEGGASIRARMETAAERMAHATREDCLEAILRQLPRALAVERELKHRQVLTDPSFQRERLAMLDARAFARISGACTSELIGLLYDWDHELGMH
ncbi:hypothetical protein ATI61_109424 [Archangium gephyra]|uniref:Sigma-70 family RNA polymerase sigma factor n=2 Tax=Archangium gephyra TaxID=48 RepID=A0ABX9JW24_9BACT|nr:hypothetical protein [Archangium gephyra]REG28080.1 hypothetical protein ATI61_109424 [Archangium gephyra]